jgi:transposase InsO family protein
MLSPSARRILKRRSTLKKKIAQESNRKRKRFSLIQNEETSNNVEQSQNANVSTKGADNELEDSGNYTEVTNPQITIEVTQDENVHTPRKETQPISTPDTNIRSPIAPINFDAIHEIANNVAMDIAKPTVTPSLPWNRAKFTSTPTSVNSTRPVNINIGYQTPVRSEVYETVEMNASRKQIEQHMVNAFVEKHLKDNSSIDFPWKEFFKIDNQVYAQVIARTLQKINATPESISKMKYTDVLDLLNNMKGNNSSFNFEDAITAAAQLCSNSIKYLEFVKKNQPEEYDPSSLEFMKKIKTYKDCPYVRTTVENMVSDLTIMFSYFAKHNVAKNERVPLLALCCELEPATRLRELSTIMNTSSLSDEDLLKILPEYLNQAITIDMHMEHYLRLDATKINISQEAYALLHCSYAINKLIKNDTNDLPSIDTIFRTIGNAQAKYYTKIDLKSAYLQIPLRKRDRDITAFTIGNRRFRFITAPLGLKHIPSEFQRKIQSLLQDHNCSNFANNFMDDIIIFSKTYEEHLEHVKKVLNAITSVNLTIRKDKCHFCCKAVPLLGFWLEEKGIRPNMKKVMNMDEWERPNTRKRVQRFCGIVNFFRRFIPNCSQLLLPIMAIREKTFNWSSNPKYEEAYQKTIQALVNNVPFLYFPVPDIPLELETDASNTALGAALFQVINGEKRYISFHSRVLKSSEVRYSMPKKELLSIIVHTNYYRPYLLGTKFILHTDAQALAYIFDKLQDTKSKNSTLMQWVSVLAEFDFEVIHIKGVDNLLADLTSRVQNIQIDENTEVEPDVKKLIEQIHKMGHFGANAIFNQIREQFEGETPKSLLKMIQKYVAQCKVCGLVNNYRVGYSPIKKPEHVMPCEYIHMDLMQLQQSTRKYNYILTRVDYFTGFVWLTPLRTKEMNEVYAAALKVFLYFGFPEKIKTDNGTEFVNKLFTDLCQLVKVEHKRIIAYNHHANGKVERQNRTIRATLRKILEDCGKTSANIWDELVPAVAFAMNARIHSGMKSSPFALMFGRGALNLYSNDWSKLDIDEERDKMLNFWKIFKAEVPKQIQQLKVQAYKQTKYHRKTVKYNVGDIVRWKKARQENLKNNFQGPFKIVEFIADEQRYIIEGANDERISAPANFLKPAVDVDGVLNDVGVETVGNPVATFSGEEDKEFIFINSNSDNENESENKLERQNVTVIKSRNNRKRTRTSTAQRRKSKQIKLDTKT